MVNARTTGAKRRTRVGSTDNDDFELFARLRRANLLLDALQSDSLEELDLSFVDYSALRILDVAGSPYQLSPSRMAELLVRTTGGMTKIVDRLEARGYVERSRDGVDRRSILVGLTDAGLAMSRKADAAYRLSRRRILTQFAPGEVEVINTQLQLLLEAFERDRAANLTD